MTSDSTSKTNSQIVDYLSKEYYGGGKPPFQILTEEEKVFPPIENFLTLPRGVRPMFFVTFSHFNIGLVLYKN